MRTPLLLLLPLAAATRSLPWGTALARSQAGRESASSFIVITNASWSRRLPAVCAPAGNSTTPCAGLLGVGGCDHVFGGIPLHGFAGVFSPSALRSLHACAPTLMLHVEHDPPVAHMSAPASSAATVRAAAAVNASGGGGEALTTLGFPLVLPWNLDRLDQRSTPLNGAFAAGGDGAGVSIYVIDSGIRGSHTEFATADGTTRAIAGYDFVSNTLPLRCSDCDGHGTHVAASAAGRRVGVAPGAMVVCVRVLDCQGQGSLSDVIAGLSWVAAHAQRPAVAILSLGVPSGDWSAALDAALAGAVRKAGVFVTVAAGNSQGDACTISPANAPDAFTVGASALPSRNYCADAGCKPAPPAGADTLYSWTDTGACVRLFAPGTDVLSACGGANRCSAVSDTAYARASGTSMAAPHAAGAAALYLQANRAASPQQVAAALVAAATPGRLPAGSLLPGTPNLLLYAGSGVLTQQSVVSALAAGAPVPRRAAAEGGPVPFAQFVAAPRRAD